MLPPRKGGRGAFTLIELLTVSGIIVLLVSLIMTAVFAVQESARISACRNHLSQLHKLIINYTANYDGYLPTFWHERWVGELGLAGGLWRDDYDTLRQRPEIAEMFLWWRQFMASPSALGDPPTFDATWFQIRDRVNQLANGLNGYEKVSQVDDINPLIAMVWNNYSPATTYLGWLDGNQRQPIRTGAAILRCPSDVGGYRCDQGPQVSYMGLAKYGWWHRGDTSTLPRYFEYHQIQEAENPSRALLLAETEPGTWQYGGCGCRWHAYKHPVRILTRHYGGGNILHFDGNVHLAKDPQERRIDYWEPDYMDWSPGW